MKKFVLTVLAIAAAASPAFAQNGDISGYADAAGTSCNVVDGAPGIVEVYLLHKHTGGGTAAQFAVATTATMTYLSVTEAPGMLRIGEANADMSLAYGGCVVGDFLIATVRYFGSGTSPACSRVTIIPAPNTPIPGEVAMVDCVQPSGNLVVPGTGQAIVNPSGPCQCNVSVSTTTWGGIKALYR